MAHRKYAQNAVCKSVIVAITKMCWQFLLSASIFNVSKEKQMISRRKRREEEEEKKNLYILKFGSRVLFFPFCSADFFSFCINAIVVIADVAIVVVVIIVCYVSTMSSEWISVLVSRKYRMFPYALFRMWVFA